MREVDLCQSCSAEIEQHDLFCQRCGSNLRLQALSEPPENVKSGRQQLQQMFSIMRDYLYLDSWKEEEDEFIAAQHHLLGVINEYISSLEKERDHLQSKIDDLHAISLARLMALMTRSRKAKLKRYHLQLKKSKERLQLFLIQQQIAQRMLERGHSDLDQLQSLITDQRKRWSHLEQLIINNGNDVAIQQLGEKTSVIGELKEQLNQVGLTYRRLHIANQMFRAIVSSIKALQENPNELMSPVEILTRTDSISGIDATELEVDRYYPSQIWVQVQRAIIFGQVLGDLKVEIRSAGTLYLGSIFDELLQFQVNEDPFETISYKQDELLSSLEEKIRYNNEIVNIVYKDYKRLNEKIDNQFSEVAMLALQQIKE